MTNAIIVDINKHNKIKDLFIRMGFSRRFYSYYIMECDDVTLYMGELILSGYALYFGVAPPCPRAEPHSVIDNSIPFECFINLLGDSERDLVLYNLDLFVGD